MIVTLNKLHKYRTLLKSDCKFINLKRNTIIDLQDSVENCINVIDKVEKEQKNDEEKYVSLITDLCNIDSILFDANVNSGLNTILHEMELKKRLLGFYTTWKENISSNSYPKYNNHSMIKHQLSELKLDTKISSSFPINIEIKPECILDEKISELRKRLRFLDDEKDKINNTFTVEIILSETSKEILGL